MIPVYTIKIPEYTVDKKPDFDAIGGKLDAKIRKHFLGKKVAIRCLSSKEHPIPMGKIISIIKKTGTDRYDPVRKGEGYENVSGKKIDFFALDFTITSKRDFMKQFVESFYIYPIRDGRPPRRLNIAIIYDRAKLKRVLHRYEGRTDVKRDGFVFKDKKSAVIGIIKIL